MFNAAKRLRWERQHRVLYRLGVVKPWAPVVEEKKAVLPVVRLTVRHIKFMVVLGGKKAEQPH